MGKILLAAILSFGITPAFAAVDAGGEGVYQGDSAVSADMATDDVSVDGQNVPLIDDGTAIDDLALPPHHGGGHGGHGGGGHGGGGHGGGGHQWFYTCYARDVAGGNFWGQAPNQYQASRLALTACRRASVFSRTCRVSYCTQN